MIYDGDDEYFLTLKGQIVYIGGYDGGLDIDIEPFELMQYTGLKDANSTEIYEGDILRIPDYYKEVILEDGSGPSTLEYHLSEVVYNEKDACFGVDIKESMEWYNEGFNPFYELLADTPDGEPIQIIGNKFQDKELLGVKGP